MFDTRAVGPVTISECVTPRHDQMAEMRAGRGSPLALGGVEGEQDAPNVGARATSESARLAILGAQQADAGP